MFFTILIAVFAALLLFAFLPEIIGFLLVWVIPISLLVVIVVLAIAFWRFVLGIAIGGLYLASRTVVRLTACRPFAVDGRDGRRQPRTPVQ